MIRIPAIALAVAGAIIAAFPAHAQSTAFVVDVLGTSSFSDVSCIENGLRRADGVSELRVIRSSRNFVRLAGVMNGERNDLLGDIAGLAQDRFAVDWDSANDGTLVITLRKLMNSPITTFEDGPPRKPMAFDA